MEVPYCDLAAQLQPLKPKLNEVLDKKLDTGQFVMGPDLKAFEENFAKYCDAPYSVGVANGTSALLLALRAMGIGAGDEVVTTPHSYFATAGAIALAGAKPVFVDIREDLNMDPDNIEAAITPQTKAIVAVHIAGRPFHVDRIQAIADKHGLHLVEDAAQSVGAKWKGQRVGSFGEAAGFSLHPLKNLFAFGDGGMITVQSEEMQKKLYQQRNHGHATRDNVEFWSYNERLDELQAAFLNITIQELDKWTEARRSRAEYYHDGLGEVVGVPREAENEFCVYQTYVIQGDRRDELQEYLKAKGICALIHYPTPIHLQPPLQGSYQRGSLPLVERVADRILSLPLFPTMTKDQQNYVIESILEFYK